MGHKAELRTQGPALVAALERGNAPDQGFSPVHVRKLSLEDSGKRAKHDESQRRRKHGWRASEPLQPPARRSAIPRLSEPAQFRMVLVSFLAAGIGLIAGGIAFLLYKLIGLFTNIVFYHASSPTSPAPRHTHLGLWVIPIPVIGGIIVGIMAKYGIVEDQRPRHSRGHGSRTDQPQPHSAPSGHPEADLGRHRHRHRRPIRRGRSDHSNRRRCRIAGGPGAFTPPRRNAKCCWRAAPRPACRPPSTPRSPA